MQYNLIDKTVMMRLLRAIIGGFQSPYSAAYNKLKPKPIYMPLFDDKILTEKAH